MLLACCFREPKSKQGKRNGQKLIASSADDEDAYVLSKSLISAPVSVGKDSKKKAGDNSGGGSSWEDQRSHIVTRPASQNGLFASNGSKKKIKAVVEESKLASTPPATKEDSKRQQSSAIKQPSFNASTPVTKPPVSSAHNQLFSPPNFTNISAIKKKEEVRDVRRMLATPEDLDESYISLSKINPASLSNSSKESLSPHCVPRSHLMKKC